MKKSIILCGISVLCWIAMFLAGTDVWHYAGSPDFWKLNGQPYNDLRVFGYAFYFQLVSMMGILLALIYSVWQTKQTKNIP